MKACSRCGEDKPLESYSKHRLGRGGLRAACKDCINRIETARRERMAAIVRTYEPGVVFACAKCGDEKPPEGFYPDKAKRSGLHGTCRECVKADRRARWADPALKPIISARNKESRKKYGQFWANSARRLRERVVQEYGGACKCCGEDTPEFLAIDHIYNDGESHRKELAGYGRSIYRWLEANGFPKDRFQLLCHNCNMAKGLYGGCPHKGTPPGRRNPTNRWNREPAA